MFNLYQLIDNAHGGQGIDSLAQQFGLSHDQADSAVKALLPSLSTAFTTKAQQPGGLGEIAGAMTDDHHQQAYGDPAVAQDPATQQKGGAIAGSIFGDNALVQEVAQKASQYTGLPATTLQQMLPVIISMVVGGIASELHGQGLGGVLGQIANSGLGGMLGGLFGGQPSSQAQPAGSQGGGGQAGADQGGGLGGMLGGLLGGLIGGGQAGGAAQGTSPQMQAGMEALSRMFHPSVQTEPGAQPDNLAGRIGSILGGKA